MINELPIEERPRERFLKEGPGALSMIELLSIVLGSGRKGKSVLDLAREILIHFGSLKDLLEASVEELTEIKGIGIVKAVKIKAIFSIALKYFRDECTFRQKIKSPFDVYDMIKFEFKGIVEERLIVILLDVRKYAFHYELVSIGTLTEVLIHPREIFYHAIKRRAKSIIIVHNHPSGDPKPSKTDISITKLLLTSSKIIGIDFNDHIIIGKNRFVSLWEEKIINREAYV